jgi:hypothetical protein
VVHQAERGRIEHALRTVAIGAGVMLVATNPRLWPMLLIGFLIFKMLGGRRVF